MLSMITDIRRAARSLLRSPYVTIVAVLSIGLGVGAATAVYSWMDGLVLHPFPAVREQDALVGIEVGEPNGGMGAWSYRTFNELAQGLRSYSGMAAWNIIRVSVRLPSEEVSTSLLATDVSPTYFDVLGVRPVLGRAITAADVETRAPVALLGDRYWRERFQGDPGVIGRTLLLNGVAVQVIGVLPPGFSGVYTGVVPQFYVPITLQPTLTGVDLLTDRKIRRWLVFARLAPGVTREAALRETDGLAKRLSAGYGDRPAPGATVMFLRVQFLGATLSPSSRRCWRSRGCSSRSPQRTSRASSWCAPTRGGTRRRCASRSAPRARACSRACSRNRSSSRSRGARSVSRSRTWGAARSTSSCRVGRSRCR